MEPDKKEIMKACKEKIIYHTKSKYVECTICGKTEQIKIKNLLNSLPDFFSTHEACVVKQLRSKKK